MHCKRDKNKPNPQKGPGIVDQMRKAKNQGQIDKLLKKSRGYKNMSKVTARKLLKLSFKKQKSFKGD